MMFLFPALMFVKYLGVLLEEGPVPPLIISASSSRPAVFRATATASRLECSRGPDPFSVSAVSDGEG